MIRLGKFLLLAAALALAGRAAPPPPLARALEQLARTTSYSWEMINLDPGPVPLNFETRRGTVKTVLTSATPDMKGSLDMAGDVLLQRQWSDGMKLTTLITKDGNLITETPEGWMTVQEILTAQAEERMKADTPTERYLWLRRADRPDVHRPDEELLPLLKSSVRFEEAGPDTYVARGQLSANASAKSGDEDAGPAYEVTITLHLRGGVIRDYDVLIQGNRRLSPRSRATVPINDHRSVVLTYVPTTRVKVPDEVRERVAPRKRGAR